MKSAIALNITLPDASALADALAALPPRHPEPQTAVTHGFCPHPVTGELVTPLGGGALAFCLLTHKKVMPPKAIKAEVAKRLATLGRRPSRKDKDEAIQAVVAEMLPVAFVEQELITLYYSAGRLIIDTASAGKAQTVIAMLIKALGPSEMGMTLPASIGAALTQEVRGALSGGFGMDLAIGWRASIARGFERVTFKDMHLAEMADEIEGYLDDGYQVEKIAICNDALDLTLSADGRLTGIKFAARECGEELDEAAAWRANAGADLALVLDVINQVLTFVGGWE